MLVTPSSADLSAYIEATLRMPITLTPWSGASALPAYLTDAYVFLEGLVQGQPVLLASALKSDIDPSAISKQLARVAKQADRPVVLAMATLTAPERRRLIELSVPFVIPGNQLFIPDLGVDLREHLKAVRERSGDTLSPSTQVVLFDYLLNGDEHGSTPSRIASRLDYSAMTVGRSIDELETLGLARIRKVGREKRVLFLLSGRELFEAALPYARDPVKDRRFVRGPTELTKLTVSGDSALSRYTDIAPSRLPVFATPPAGRGHGKVPVTEVTAAFEAEFELETWRYDPRLLAENGVADRLSLYVRYKDDPDPRIGAAAADLLEGMPWRS